MLLYNAQRFVSGFDPRRQFGIAGMTRRQMPPDVADDGNLRLAAVLFEEQPLQHFGPGKPCAGQQGGFFSEEAENGIRFPKSSPVFQHNGRNLAVGVQSQKLRRPRAAMVDIQIDDAMRQGQVRQKQAHLVSVARIPIVIKSQHFTALL